MGHNCIDHSYTGIGHNYMGHNYMGHTYIGQNHMGQNKHGRTALHTAVGAMPVHVSIRTSALHVCTHVCAHAFRYACTHACTHVYTHAHMHVYAHVYTLAHAHAYAQAQHGYLEVVTSLHMSDGMLVLAYELWHISYGRPSTVTSRS